jgi:hypothetical protein
MRAHARARAGTFLLETERFFSSRSGRACPLVPELTYPFCTRHPQTHLSREDDGWR